ncbi:MAG: hypothetical protein AAB652_00570 [Patescibacteria group bacterium]
MPYYNTDGFTQVVTPLQNLWSSSITFVPILVSALVVFVVGLVVASGLGMLVERIFASIKLDSVLKQLGFEPHFERAGLRLHASRFLGQLAFWFLTVAFLLAASDILGLPSLSIFLREVLSYIPNVVAAVLIMLAAVVIAGFTRASVQASVKGARLPSAHFLGSLTWWVIVIFGLLATLSQLNVAAEVVQSIVTGFIAMLALAGGLAFGLGGRDYAAHLIGKLREHTESH